MRFVLPALLLLVSIPAHAQGTPDPGLIVIRSSHSVAATLDKLEAIVTKKGFTVFARIDHAAGARKVGKSLRPTQLLIFGNPKVGTALMSARQSVGLDLPIRVAAWEDEDGGVWVGYNDPAWLASRYGIKGRDKVIAKMTGALAKLTGAAAR